MLQRHSRLFGDFVAAIADVIAPRFRRVALQGAQGNRETDEARRRTDGGLTRLWFACPDGGGIFLPRNRGTGAADADRRPIRFGTADITDANTRRSAGGILPAAAGAFGCHAGNLAGRNGNNGFIRICTDGEINAVMKPK